MSLATEIPIFDYYGLVLSFHSDDRIPVRVYGTFDKRQSIIQLEIVNGIYKGIILENVPKSEPLLATEKATVQLLIDNYISDILNLWIDTFVYNKKVSKEIIKKKIEKPLI